MSRAAKKSPTARPVESDRRCSLVDRPQRPAPAASQRTARPDDSRNGSRGTPRPSRSRVDVCIQGGAPPLPSHDSSRKRENFRYVTTVSADCAPLRSARPSGGGRYAPNLAVAERPLRDSSRSRVSRADGRFLNDPPQVNTAAKVAASCSVRHSRAEVRMAQVPTFREVVEMKVLEWLVAHRDEGDPWVSISDIADQFDGDDDQLAASGSPRQGAATWFATTVRWRPCSRLPRTEPSWLRLRVRAERTRAFVARLPGHACCSGSTRGWRARASRRR